MRKIKTAMETSRVGCGLLPLKTIKLVEIKKNNLSEARRYSTYRVQTAD